MVEAKAFLLMGIGGKAIEARDARAWAPGVTRLVGK
jgi:hypothetical protein